MKKNLIWQLYLLLITITLLGHFVIARNVAKLIRLSYINEKKTSLEQIGGTGSSLFVDLIENGDLSGIQERCNQIDQFTRLRVTAIDPEGKVLGDSRQDPQKMVNHFDRPEFQTALTGETGSDIRSSETLGVEMLYVAVPIKTETEDRVVAVLRISVAMSNLHAILHSLFAHMIRYGLITIALLWAAGLAFAWRLSRRIKSLREGADRFARGELSHRLEIPNIHDIADLADSMNKMAAQLDERIRTITAQKNEQQAMLSSMIEGVIAVDQSGHVMSVNSAASRMLQIGSRTAVGRTVEEVVRNKDLQLFVRKVMSSELPVEAQVVLHELNQTEQYIQVHGSALRNEQHAKIGALIVLYDMTRIRQLEQVRRDFVANVSHELKTPVTSIKGFIETLLDGALDNPEDAARFLEIIARQTNRLNSIIDDLLTLSRIEQRGADEQISLEPAKIRPIVAAAANLCAMKAAEKNIEIDVDCDPNLIAEINASLLEQAIVNLVDNAVKYSNPGGRVRLEALREENKMLIRVSDSGCGISKEHLPRIFERFYRVDKARSRNLGGTGLGLAIVKHITQAHQGTVTVESTVGQGSIFTLRIPSDHQN